MQLNQTFVISTRTNYNKKFFQEQNDSFWINFLTALENYPYFRNKKKWCLCNDYWKIVAERSKDTEISFYPKITAKEWENKNDQLYLIEKTLINNLLEKLSEENTLFDLINCLFKINERTGELSSVTFIDKEAIRQLKISISDLSNVIHALKLKEIFNSFTIKETKNEIEIKETKKCSICVQIVGENKVYCSNHQKPCQENSCTNRIVGWANYCPKHQIYLTLQKQKTCRECDQEIAKEDIYCQKHWNACLTTCADCLANSNYCSSHESKCLICSNRTSFKTLCQEHKNVCIEKGCLQWIPEYNSSFTENELALISRYRNGVPFISSSFPSFFNQFLFCENHRYACKYKGDEAPKNSRFFVLSFPCEKRVKFDSYCSSHSNLCSSCSNRIAVWETYCVQHANKCANCSTRISNSQQYCQQHVNQCFVCSTRISNSVSYCINHNSVCSQSRCHQRISNNQSYCANHTKYCLANNCYQRIANYQNYCNSCQEQQLAKEAEQTKLKSLVKANTSLNPQTVERFSTDWNNNCAIIIALNNGSYWVHLLVLDSENNSVKVFPVNSDCQWWGESKREKHNYLSDAQSEANWLQSKLKYDSNPILVVHPSCDSYRCFERIVDEPYVKIDYNASTSEFKPLDIAWVEKSNCGKRYNHAGVYIGNGELIEYNNDEKIDNFLTNFLRGGITRKASWSEFLKGQKGNIRRYHPTIPFKKHQEIIAQLVWAKDNGFWKENYNLANRNCQHFANMAALGINYSPEVENKRGEIIAKHAGHIPVRVARTTAGIAATGWLVAVAPATFGLSLIPAAITGVSTAVGVVDYVEKVDNGDFQINNGKGSTIKLTSEIQESNSKLGKKSDSKTRNLEARAEQAMPSYIPTENCRIM